MKPIFSFFLSLCFVAIGFGNAFRQKKCTKALEEAVKFISTVRNQVRFQRAEFKEIYDNAKAENYSFILLENERISLKEYAGEKNIKQFSDFVNKIGTTDEEGQISLCDEYYEKLSNSLKEQAGNEQEKIQVHTSLSVLAALCVFIFFL